MSRCRKCNLKYWSLRTVSLSLIFLLIRKHFGFSQNSKLYLKFHSLHLLLIHLLRIWIPFHREKLNAKIAHFSYKVYKTTKLRSFSIWFCCCFFFSLERRDLRWWYHVCFPFISYRTFKAYRFSRAGKNTDA